MSRGYERCDIMTDQYFVESLKEGTRKKRGDDGSAIQFTGDTQFPSNFGDFLSNSVDKNSSILSVDAIHNPVFMAKESLLFGMHGCLSPSQQNLRIHLLTLASIHLLYPRKT